MTNKALDLVATRSKLATEFMAKCVTRLTAWFGVRTKHSQVWNQVRFQVLDQVHSQVWSQIYEHEDR